MKKENKKPLEETVVGKILSLVFVIGLIWWFFAEDFNKDKNDKYEYKDDGASFTEAKCIFGPIFNKDTLVLSKDNIEIFSRSFFGEKKTVRPYSNLKEVTFSKAFVGYKIVIEYPSGFLVNNWTTFYFNQKDTFDLLKILFKEYSKNRCVITESL